MVVPDVVANALCETIPSNATPAISTASLSGLHVRIDFILFLLKKYN
jgi:hypothetical protein